ncbi:unnamed protein product [Haemonchus placei]|uniref:Uncharacterized protein n=1 Tax=Haemonchus placei TaxID=6290 RepID=A0A0N4WD59_HAEPC|nr:unnamed protein product [Haemonchus placei]
MASPPSSPVHLHVRKLSVTNEEGTSGQQSVRKPGKKIAALVGEDEMSGPPPVQSNPKSRFRNGHASFRLRMLQEQHGTGFEPVSHHTLHFDKFQLECGVSEFHVFNLKKVNYGYWRSYHCLFWVFRYCQNYCHFYVPFLRFLLVLAHFRSSLRQTANFHIVAALSEDGVESSSNVLTSVS